MSLLWASNVGQNKMRDFVIMNDLFQIASKTVFILFPRSNIWGLIFSVKSFHQLLQLGGHCGRRQGGRDDLFPISSISFPYFSPTPFSQEKNLLSFTLVSQVV